MFFIIALSFSFLVALSSLASPVFLSASSVLASLSSFFFFSTNKSYATFETALL